MIRFGIRGEVSAVSPLPVVQLEFSVVPTMSAPLGQGD